ncbi:putative nucleolar protein Jip5 [Piedraia hortae CBS 480.64]|uniref:WD repeat-containing protein JIP5 n=1 Tax=Piedraia hortae CBS 480.64 TaxID=1314780 RepID=A0A6A7BV70_9PEZI|nr:putative nucleolar protein Jip5 [Piedraia hortae CBS 480.64]
MFDTLCNFPLRADLFAQDVHPTAPLVAVGLSTGHVETLKLPPAEARQGVVDTQWQTRRHKGSCRALSYSVDGNQLYSAGTDGIVKAADSESGQVVGKVAVPRRHANVDPPALVHVLSSQTLLLGTDSGALHIFDLRDPAPHVPASENKAAFTTPRPAQTHYPHIDYITSLTPLPPSATSTSGYSKQWLSTGGTTLAIIDLRSGVLVKSEDQEQLLLSSVYITGLRANKSKGTIGERALVGGGDGVITLWEKGHWDDQVERIVVSQEQETLDCLARVPETIAGRNKTVVVGLGDGSIRFVSLGLNKVVGIEKHDEIDGVTQIGFDFGGRMISGGGHSVKVWQDQNDAIDGASASGEELDSGDSRGKRKAHGDGSMKSNGVRFVGLD